LSEGLGGEEWVWEMELGAGDWYFLAGDGKAGGERGCNESGVAERCERCERTWHNLVRSSLGFEPVLRLKIRTSGRNHDCNGIA